MEYNNWYLGVKNKYNNVKFSVQENGFENIFNELKQYWNIYIVKKNKDGEIWSEKIVKYDKEKEKFTLI